MATTTPNLGLLKPVVGASADEWGDDLNASLDTLDAKVLDKTTGGTVSGNLSVTGTVNTPNVNAATTLNLQTGGSTKATLTSGGNLLVGTTGDEGFRINAYITNGNLMQLYQPDGTANRRLIVTANATGANAGITFNATSSAGNDNFIVQVSSSERARITSAGYFKASNTGSYVAGVGSSFHEFNSNVGGPVVYGYDSLSSSTGQTFYSKRVSNAGGQHYLADLNGTTVFQVANSGQISSTSTTITSISDQRMKENIRPLPDGLAAINALQPRMFDWKEGKGRNVKNDRGFIAQEFETVFPDMIEEWKDGDETYKALRADLIPILVKAVQELSAELNALKARL